jgi:hypothetical protein
MQDPPESRPLWLTNRRARIGEIFRKRWTGLMLTAAPIY